MTDAREAAEQALAELLRQAGPRPEADPQLLAQVKAAVRPAWQSAARQHAARHRRRLLAWALPIAAVLVLAVGMSRLPGLWVAGGSAMASVEVVRGEVERTDTAGDLRVDDTLPVGVEIATHEGTVALRLSNGASLRLDRHSRLRLAGGGEVTAHLELLDGRLYADTGEALGGRTEGQRLEVITPLGTAQDIGTQFEVQLADDSLGLAVRQGRVDLLRDDQHQRVDAGQRLRVLADGSIERSELPGYDDSWSWVLELAPPFEIEGRSVADFLAWAAHETGTTLRWASPELAAEAATSTVHGSLEGLTPRTALEVVPPASGLTTELVDGDLRVWKMGDRR